MIKAGQDIMWATPRQNDPRDIYFDFLFSQKVKSFLG